MILVSFGTRPEWIKIKPVLDQMEGKIPFKLLFTGQHEDLLANVDFNAEITRLSIKNGSNRLDSIVESVMNLDEIFDGVDALMVQGDTSSAFAVALAAFHRKIKVIHLEAGLRTYDKNQPYPEEFNRQAISRIADIHLCPTRTSRRNLVNESVEGVIRVVGNTVLDNLRDVETEYTNKIIVTMHRRENHHNMDKWFEVIDKLAEKNKDLEFIIPLHPNPNVQKHKHIFKHVKVVDPMEYNEFIQLMAKSKFVITDSGGLQEETSFLNKKCIVCREKTERQEGIGTFAIKCTSPEDLERLFNNMNENHIPTGQCPYGDGYAAEKAFEVIASEIPTGLQ